MRRALCLIAVVVAMFVGSPREAISADVCLGVGPAGGPLMHILFIDVEGVTANGYFNLNGQDNCSPGASKCSPLNGTAFSFQERFIHFGTITHGGMVCPNPVTIEGILSGLLVGTGTMWHHDGGVAIPVAIAPVPCPVLGPPCSPK